MWNWLPYPIYLTAFFTAVLSLRMFWVGGTLTLLSGFLVLSGSLYALWYTFTHSHKSQPSVRPELDFIPLVLIWVGVGGLEYIQRSFFDIEHGDPASFAFNMVIGILILVSLLVMAALLWFGRYKLSKLHTKESV